MVETGRRDVLWRKEEPPPAKTAWLKRCASSLVAPLCVRSNYARKDRLDNEMFFDQPRRETWTSFPVETSSDSRVPA